MIFKHSCTKFSHELLFALLNVELMGCSIMLKLSLLNAFISESISCFVCCAVLICNDLQERRSVDHDCLIGRFINIHYNKICD